MKKHFDPNDKTTLAAMVREVLNTRDFCGNEYDVFRDWSRYYDITEQQWFDYVITAANQEWDRSLMEARLHE